MPHRRAAGRQFGHPAQVKIAFARPVKIRAARSQQTQALGMARKQQGLFRGMASSNDLNSRAAQIAEFQQQLVQCALAQLVARRVGNYRSAAAAADPAHCFA